MYYAYFLSGIMHKKLSSQRKKTPSFELGLKPATRGIYLSADLTSGLCLAQVTHLLLVGAHPYTAAG